MSILIFRANSRDSQHRDSGWTIMKLFKFWNGFNVDWWSPGFLRAGDYLESMDVIFF